MPTFQLTATLLLLLTRSLFATHRPPQPPSSTVTSPMTSSSRPRHSKTTQTMIDDGYPSNKLTLEVLENLYGFSVNTSVTVSAGRLCLNCSASVRSSYPVPVGWQGDGVGVLPFYRVRSDLQRTAAKVVTILGLFELSTGAGDRPEGRSELAAALLAIKHVNQRRLLGDYQLRILTNDTKTATDSTATKDTIARRSLLGTSLLECFTRRYGLDFQDKMFNKDHKFNEVN